MPEEIIQKGISPESASILPSRKKRAAGLNKDAEYLLDLQEVDFVLLELEHSKTYLPERLEVVPELPKTPSGKVQKFRLREIAKSLKADR